MNHSLLQQRLTLELGEDIGGTNPGIDQVAEHEINDPVLSPKWNRRFCSILGQRVEAGPPAAGEHHCEYATAVHYFVLFGSKREVVGFPRRHRL